MGTPWRLVNRFIDLHSTVYRLSGGLIGGRIPGGPKMLLLDHVGAKSGRKRTNPLVYIEDGDDLVIVASKGGHPRHPAWFHNLMANPATVVQTGLRRRNVQARRASDEEHERLWPRVVDAYSGYQGYQRKTQRRIPLVILEPRG
jgi:deazaflavin-dependent oxidoreductase (nitroreductase family)